MPFTADAVEIQVPSDRTVAVPTCNESQTNAAGIAAGLNLGVCEFHS